MVERTDSIESISPSPPAAGKHRKLTAGEIAIERGIFTGVGFGVNEASSLWITNQFLHGKNLLGKAPGFLKTAGNWFSKDGFDRVSHFLAGQFKVADKIIEGKKITGSQRAGNMLLMVTLLSGGTLLVWPMKKMKDHEEVLVRKANHFFDWLKGSRMSKEEVEARDAEVDAALACKPRQSWWTMLPARVIAMMSSVGAGTFLVGKKNNDRLMDWSEKFFTGGVQPAEQRTIGHNYARLVAVETYSCATASIVLELVSKFFARKKPKLHNQALCDRTASGYPVNADAGASSSTAKKLRAAKAPASYIEQVAAQKEAGSQAQMGM